MRVGGGGVHAHPFHTSYEVVIYASAERADTLPLFHLYPYMYSVLATTEYIYWFYFARPHLFLQQASGQIYKDDVCEFFFTWNICFMVENNVTFVTSL